MEEQINELTAVKDDFPTLQPKQEIFKKIDDTKNELVKNETEEAIDKLHTAAVLSEVQNNKEYNDKFINQAHATIDNKLKEIDQKNIDKLQKSTYDANKEACENYGIDNAVPLWQIKLMKAGSYFWFVIYWIVASLTICPISTFAKGLKRFIKSTWLVILVAVVTYLIIVVVIPVLSVWLSNLQG